MVVKSRKNINGNSLNDKTNSHQKKISKRSSQLNSTTPNQNNKSIKSHKVIKHIKGIKSDKSLYFGKSNLIKSRFNDKMNDTNKETQTNKANINKNEKNNTNLEKEETFVNVGGSGGYDANPYARMSSSFSNETYVPGMQAKAAGVEDVKNEQGDNTPVVRGSALKEIGRAHV